VLHTGRAKEDGSWAAVMPPGSHTALTARCMLGEEEAFRSFVTPCETE
jgi:hypothetical protein